MRGLSAHDAYMLTWMAHGGEAPETNTEVCRALVARGCAMRVSSPNRPPPPGSEWTESYQITPVGRLALRVSVAIPAVTP